jgi:hypothetical protein
MVKKKNFRAGILLPVSKKVNIRAAELQVNPSWQSSLSILTAENWSYWLIRLANVT